MTAEEQLPGICFKIDSYEEIIDKLRKKDSLREIKILSINTET